MIRSCSFSLLCAAAALLAAERGMALPATGARHTVFTTVSIDDADAPGRCPGDGVLAVPATWQVGDAAALIIAAAAPTIGQDGLAAALLAEGTAVLEVGDATRCRDETPALARAALRDTIGPGAMVVIGFGGAGDRALAATRDGFVAGIAVSGASARIVAGPPAPPEEQIDRRWPRFCAVLAANTPIGAAACTAALPPAPARFAGAAR